MVPAIKMLNFNIIINNELKKSVGDGSGHWGEWDSTALLFLD